MGSIEDVIAIVPLRGGSKSIPKKNIKMLADKPMAMWVIDAACESVSIQKVYIATDSFEIVSVLEAYMKGRNTSIYNKVEFFMRSDETSTDTASTESVLDEIFDTVETNEFFLIQATSPYIQSEDLDNAYRLYKKEKYDSLLTCVRQKRFIWTDEEMNNQPVNYNYKNRPRRQEFKGYLVENGAFYINKQHLYLESGNRLNGNIGIYEMESESYNEIDDRIDWIIVEKLLLARQSQKAISDFSRIKMLVIDCDGVLTDGTMYYNTEGEMLKAFNTRDGMGIRLLQERNVPCVIMTGEKHSIVTARAKKIGIEEVRLGVQDKLACLKEMIDDKGIMLEEVAYIGDDINDLEAMKAAGVAFCPNDAVKAIQEIADYVLPIMGGKGVVRRVCDLIIEGMELE